MKNLIFHFEDVDVDVENFVRKHLAKHVKCGPGTPNALYFINYRDPRHPTILRPYPTLVDHVLKAIAKEKQVQKRAFIVDLNRTGGDAITDFTAGLQLIDELAVGFATDLKTFLAQEDNLVAIRSFYLDELNAVVKLVPNWAINARQIRLIWRASPPRSGTDLGSHRIADDVGRSLQLITAQGSRVLVAHKRSDEEWLAQLIGRWLES